MVHDFVLKNGEFNIFSDIKWDIVDCLNCIVIYVCLPHSPFSSWRLKVLAIKLWVAILQESLFIDIVLRVSGTGTEVLWVSFNIRIQSRGIVLHNAR